MLFKMKNVAEPVARAWENCSR